MRRCLSLFVGLLVLAGCGGGGSDGVHPVATFRANIPGDLWNYDVNIDFGVFGAYTGTLTEGLSNDTYNGHPSIKFSRTFNLMLQQGPATLNSYEELSQTGVLEAELVASGLVAVTSDTFNVPPTIGIGTKASGTITLANSLNFVESYAVVGKTLMATRAGIFNCWIVNQTVVHSDGTTDRYQMWIAPETGNFVRIDDTTVNPDGTGYHYIASLTSTVSPPAQPLATTARQYLPAPLMRLR